MPQHSEKRSRQVQMIDDKIVIVIDPADAVSVRSALHDAAKTASWEPNRKPLERLRDDIGLALGSSRKGLKDWNRTY